MSCEINDYAYIKDHIDKYKLALAAERVLQRGYEA